MLLNELTGYKKYTKMTWDEFIQELEKRGTLSASGALGYTILPEGKNYVYKVWYLDEGYTAYIDAVKKHQHNPYFVKLLGPVKHKNLGQKLKDIREAAIVLHSVKSKVNLRLDLHSGNWMIRNNNGAYQVVITDPFVKSGFEEKIVMDDISNMDLIKPDTAPPSKKKLMKPRDRSDEVFGEKRDKYTFDNANLIGWATIKTLLTKFKGVSYTEEHHTAKTFKISYSGKIIAQALQMHGNKLEGFAYLTADELKKLNSYDVAVTLASPPDKIPADD